MGLHKGFIWVKLGMDCRYLRLCNAVSGIFLENNFKYQNTHNNEFGGAISANYGGFFTISCFLFDIFRGGMAP